MAEIIEEPTALSKVIALKFKINDVDVPKTTQLPTNKQFNTTDTDAWFTFELDGLATTNGTYNLTLINLDDKSIFHHADVLFAALPFHYKLNSSEDVTLNEIRHAGRWLGQLVVTLSNGDTTARQFGFNIAGHILDGQDAQVILLSDYQALINTINLAKDDLAQYNIDFAALIADVTTAEGVRKQAEIDRAAVFAALVESEMVAQNVATKLTEKEATFAPRMLSLESELAEKIGGGVKAEPEDLSATTLGLVTGTGGPINLLSIPQDDSVTPEKTTFIQKSTNILNFDDLYYDKSLSSGNLVDNVGKVVTGFVSVKKSTPFILDDIISWSRYDASSNFITSGSNLSVPAIGSDVYYRMVFDSTKKNTVQMNLGTTLLPYEEPYGYRIRDTIDVPIKADSVSSMVLQSGAVLNRHLSSQCVSIENTTFIKKSTNLFDKRLMVVDKGLDPITGAFIDNTSANATEIYTEIKPSKTYTINGIGVRRFFYDENYAPISTSTTAGKFITPINAKYIRFAAPDSQVNILQLNEGDTLLVYEEFYEYLDKRLLQITLDDLPQEETVEEVHLYEFAPTEIIGELAVTSTVEGLDGTGANAYIHDNLTVAQVYAWYDALVAAYPNYVTREQIGTDASNTYPIYCYTFKPEDIVQSPTVYAHRPLPKVILGSGMHGAGASGDKHESIFSLYFLMKDVCANWLTQDLLEYMRHNVILKIIPLQNPWAIQNKMRTNSNGVDINRNFGTTTWMSGTVGTPDYGGLVPFSESETQALRDFITANDDAVLVIDYHTTGGTPTDDKWIYFEMPPSCELYYPASHHIRKLSAKWKADGYFLTEQEHYGYIYNASGGKYQLWVNQNMGILSCVLESAPNIQSNNGTLHRKMIMDMAYENYANWVVHVLKYLKDK